MALVRWSPWQGLYEMQRDMDQLMTRVFGGTSPAFPTFGRRSWVPAVDVFNRDQDLVIRAELPGIDPENDVEISFKEGVLTIRGERRQEQQHEGNGTYRSEFSYGSSRGASCSPKA